MKHSGSAAEPQCQAAYSVCKQAAATAWPARVCLSVTSATHQLCQQRLWAALAHTTHSVKRVLQYVAHTGVRLVLHACAQSSVSRGSHNLMPVAQYKHAPWAVAMVCCVHLLPCAFGAACRQYGKEYAILEEKAHATHKGIWQVCRQLLYACRKPAGSLHLLCCTCCAGSVVDLHVPAIPAV